MATRRERLMNTWGKAIEQYAYAILSRTGYDTALYIKKLLETPDSKGYVHSDEGQVKDTITYATLGVKSAHYLPEAGANKNNPNRALVGSDAGYKGVIKKTTIPFYCKIGTADPAGWYLEKGTGSHENRKGHAQFMRNILGWGTRHNYGSEAELTPIIDYIDTGRVTGSMTAEEMKAHPFYRLVRHIQKHGTKPHPFIRNAIPFAQKQLALAARRLYLDLKHRVPTIKTVISDGKVTSTV